ncbi:MAG: hypothetical protein Q7U47_14375 [Paludibacter sp.]|nr:hypothetical protein [Paludibacter sp.]
MKKIIFIVASFILLCITSCKIPCPPISKPKDLQPIDWENYNDVKTVYYNCVKYCSEKSIMEGRKVKVCGWKLKNLDGFAISDDSLNGSGPSILIHIPKPEQNCKFYIKGTISLPCTETVDLLGRNCSKSFVEILVDSISLEK